MDKGQRIDILDAKTDISDADFKDFDKLVAITLCEMESSDFDFTVLLLS